MSTSNIFVSWKEFPTYGLPKYSRNYVNEMVDAGTFPPPIRLGANRIAWRLSDLERWLATRPVGGDPIPVLWPVRPAERGRGAPQRDYSKPQGRLPGSRIYIDEDGKRRVLRPGQQLEAADVAA